MRDVLKIYGIEKKKLEEFFANTKQSVCLTTECWTSIQNVSYLCLTAHIVDHNWTLHKRILNFCVIPSHKGREIGKVIELCLLDWGIENVCTITVDNATSNDVAIDYLKKMMSKKKVLRFDGQFLHMRCCAHILNLIVKEGIEEVKESISRIHAALKYTRSSPGRV